MKKENHVGITIIGTLFMIGSILLINRLFSIQLLPVKLAILIFALLGIYVAMGLFMLKSPARLTAIALIALNISYAIIRTFKDYKVLISKSPMPSSVVLLLCLLVVILIVSIDIGIIYYLTRPRIKEQFK